MAAGAPVEVGPTSASNQYTNTGNSINAYGDASTSLKVPTDPLSTSRPESPVNRKRADDDSLSGQGHRHEDGSHSGNSLPPTKKSKTSPPLAPSTNIYSSNSGHSLSDYRTSRETIDDALSPQTSPILEPLVPLSTSMSEKRYSPVAENPTQSKARKLDDDRPLSPPFRVGSPPFRTGSPTFRATSPSFGRSATAILDSLSKPGENSLGNLNLGTPIIGRTPVGERVMGVITSQPNSRQASPDPRPTPGAMETGRLSDAREGAQGVDRDLNNTTFRLDENMPGEDAARTSREPSPAGAMPISDDDIHHDYDQEEDDPIRSLAEEPMHPIEGPFSYSSDTGSDYGDDSLDEIDVEGMGMLDSDSDSEDTPYQDPDPMCLDRLSEEETDIILEEARMHGISYVIRKYILSGLITTKKMLLMTIPEKASLCCESCLFSIEIPETVTESQLIRTISAQLKRILRRRKRLQHIHSLEHVVKLLKTSKRIMVLTGAGVSVSCGIPDFRSEDGIYSRLSEFQLDDPQQMFDLGFFRERPEIFYSFAREIFPSNFTPSPSHYFIKLLEDQDKLLRNYTQNIDTLEQKAGIRKVLQCHGSFATASCVRCGHQVPGDDIKEQIFKQEVAYCKACKTPSPPPKAKKRSKSRYHSSDEDESDDDDDINRALMKPDIVFFGEKLPAEFHKSLKEDRKEVDLLIVIGSSLKVAPVSDIMHELPNSVPQILINRTPNRQMEFDVQLLGNCDAIVAELCRMAGWELRHEKLPGGTSAVPDMEKNTNSDGSGVGGRAAWSFIEPNTYLFEGADLEEINFELIQERNRQRVQDEIDDDAPVENDESSDEEELDVEDMEGLAGDPPQRRLLSQSGRAASTGPMDEDVVEDEQESDSGSEHSQDTIKGTGGAMAAGASSSVSPRIQPIGFATGTTEPRSGSITEIHQGVIPAAKAEAATLSSSSLLPSLHSPTFGGIDSRQSHSQAAQDEDDEEEAKIRVMFTEKMPKDLGEEDGDMLGHGPSRRPSEDLMPITEDTQLEIDDDEGRSTAKDDIDLGGPLEQTALASTSSSRQTTGPTNASLEES
ncbi:NAD-dependent histone deacetylase sir2 [Gamsiella multidivaricata]|nr:NAD-dependent histone deacetylase sir2 [Gamsiella multidivaricata]